MTVVVVGIVLGTLGGYALGRALDAQLRGVSAGNATTHALPAAALTVTAAVAVWLPARRAAATDPMRVLREEWGARASTSGVRPRRTAPLRAPSLRACPRRT